MIINGTGASETLNGGVDADTISGLGGNDTIFGNEENDILNGNGGDDQLIGGLGNDTLNGGFGNDFFDGGEGDDVIRLGPGDQAEKSVLVSRGDDIVDFAQLGDDTFVSFFAGNDALGMLADVDGVENTATIVTEYDFGEFAFTDFNDVNAAMTLTPSSSNGGLSISGTSGDDLFLIDAGEDGWIQVRPGDGFDEIQIEGDGFVRLDYRDASDSVFVNLHFGVVGDASPGFGLDRITGDGRVNEFRASDFDDELYGSNEDDRFITRMGDDFVAGRGGRGGFAAIGGDCNLSATGDLNEAAANLYDCLHRGAASEKPRIAVAPIPYGEVGRAINDRLRRAATPGD